MLRYWVWWQICFPAQAGLYNRLHSSYGPLAGVQNHTELPDKLPDQTGLLAQLYR